MSLPTPYYSDGQSTIYCAPFEELYTVLRPPDQAFDLVLADPPYGETALKWDKWVDGWPTMALWHSRQLWCFGSTRMFIEHIDEFKPWTLAQDLVWEKHNGSGVNNDRFRRVHENVYHFYSGDWASLYHKVPVTHDATKRTIRLARKPQHWGHINDRVG